MRLPPGVSSTTPGVRRAVSVAMLACIREVFIADAIEMELAREASFEVAARWRRLDRDAVRRIVALGRPAMSGHHQRLTVKGVLRSRSM